MKNKEDWLLVFSGICFAIFVITHLTHCADVRKEVLPTDNERAAQLIYYKDTRTNLCFVANNVPTEPFNSTIFTNVPCTAEVERLLQK